MTIAVNLRENHARGCMPSRNVYGMSLPAARPASSVKAKRLRPTDSSVAEVAATAA